jgi:hypothetical protein
MQTVVRLHLAKLRAVFKKRQIVKAIGDRDVALGCAAELFRTEKTMVEVDKLRRIFGKICDVA